mgnify:CR=1 FL=1
MTEKEKIELLEEIMELDEDTLNLESVLEDLEEWDSLSKLSLMAESKKRFGKNLSVNEIRGFVTVKDICEYLQ